MDKRSRLFPTAFLVALLGAPVIAWSAGEPVATAPIPPPPPAVPAQPATPMFVPPNASAAPKASVPKPVAKAPKKKTQTAARPHRHKRVVARKPAADGKREAQQTVVKAPPPPAPRPRAYAGVYSGGPAIDGPPHPPPWYEGPPFAGYYPPPWRRGPAPW